MRTSILIVLFCLSAFAMADQTKFQSKLTSLLNLQAKAVDAIDSALQLLRDLKQANVDEQAAADELNRTQEEMLGKQIADLTFIADQNKATGDEATANRKHIEQEIAVTHEYLVWINQRRNDIYKQKEANREHRCVANMMFIKALKEHDEALEVIRFLKEDIVGIVNEAEGQVDLAQIKDTASKLSAYTHLFNMSAMKAFNQLSQDVGSPQDVDAETAEWDAKADDNDRQALQVQRMGAGSDDRDVGHKLIDAVNRLEQHIIDSIADLEKNEIQAAWDFSQWLQDIEAELIYLDKEQAQKTTYIDKLLIAIVGAKAHEDRVWEIYFESASTLNDAIDDLNAKRAWYAQEKARREEENAILDEVIQMFLDRVSQIDSGMRNKVNDFADDGQFQDSDISRRTDTAYSKDYGNLKSNVESESRA